MRENWQLVTNEPVEVQDHMKITDHFKGIYRIYPNFMKENRRMWTCNRLDLQTLGSQPVMPKNLPDHCSRRVTPILTCTFKTKVELRDSMHRILRVADAIIMAAFQATTDAPKQIRQLYFQLHPRLGLSQSTTEYFPHAPFLGAKLNILVSLVFRVPSPTGSMLTYERGEMAVTYQWTSWTDDQGDFWA